ncbi:Protein of unknown function [Cotesia congregata]|uniref:Uncharacterized protein n=2 Tax=Cotesia TaxID=32390 RepID=A0A8J2H5R8_COTCN|nr:hypothetical protein KQX54_013580 [Cotesia glomerata]CAG5075613.1 Protein of unknown function [Cotesia congregata]
MGWVALGRRAGGSSRLSPILSLSLASLVSSLLFTTLCVLTLALTFATFVRSEDIFEEGKSDKEILDNLLLSTRYDKRLLPPVQGTLRPPPHTRQDDYIPDHLDSPNDQPNQQPEHHLRHHRHQNHHTARHNHSSLLTSRRKGTSLNLMKKQSECC